MEILRIRDIQKKEKELREAATHVVKEEGEANQVSFFSSASLFCIHCHLLHSFHGLLKMECRMLVRQTTFIALQVTQTFPVHSCSSDYLIMILTIILLCTNVDSTTRFYMSQVCFSVRFL